MSSASLALAMQLHILKIIIITTDTIDNLLQKVHMNSFRYTWSCVARPFYTGSLEINPHCMYIFHYITCSDTFVSVNYYKGDEAINKILN